jgi:uncharacterized protein DUF4255
VASVDVIADMSTTLVEVLTPAVSSLPCDVRLSNADEFRTFAPITPTITVFLYHIGINGELRNNAPRRLGGTSSAPFLPLELRYLITPWTAQPLTGHRIMGHVMRRLAEFQTMTRKTLSGDSWNDDETVQLLPENLTLDEYHDIWEPAEIAYKLSMSYIARVIALDPATVTTSPIVVSASITGPATP